MASFSSSMLKIRSVSPRPRKSLAYILFWKVSCIGAACPGGTGQRPFRHSRQQDWYAQCRLWAWASHPDESGGHFRKGCRWWTNGLEEIRILFLMHRTSTILRMSDQWSSSCAVLRSRLAIPTLSTGSRILFKQTCLGVLFKMFIGHYSTSSALHLSNVFGEWQCGWEDPFLLFPAQMYSYMR